MPGFLCNAGVQYVFDCLPGDALEHLRQCTDKLHGRQPFSLPVGFPISGLALYRRQKKLQEAAQALGRIDIDESRATEFLSEYLYERGALLDKQGHYAEAFNAYTRGGAVKARVKNVRYDRDEQRQFFGRLKAFFTRERMARLPRARVDQNAPRPIFIVGFPRSGTTLLEQILCSHPEISAGVYYDLDANEGLYWSTIDNQREFEEFGNVTVATRPWDTAIDLLQSLPEHIPSKIISPSQREEQLLSKTGNDSGGLDST